MLLCLDNKQVWEELAHEKGENRNYIQLNI